jgi:hypothetical protein
MGTMDRSKYTELNLKTVLVLIRVDTIDGSSKDRDCPQNSATLSFEESGNQGQK